MTDETTDRELHDTHQQPQEGDGQQEEDRRIGVNDVLHRSTCDNHQRTGPQVVTQVADGDDLLMQTMEEMLHDIGEKHGDDEHQEHLAKDEQESAEESHVGRLLNHRETDGHQQGSDEVGKEGVGGHLLQRTAQLLRDYGSRCGTGRDDTHQDGLHENETVALQTEDEDDGHQHANEQHLKQARPEMPTHRT